MKKREDHTPLPIYVPVVKKSGFPYGYLAGDTKLAAKQNLKLQEEMLAPLSDFKIVKYGPTARKK